MESFANVLGGLGIGSIVAAVIAGLWVRRKINAETSKLGADASLIIQQAATGVVEMLKRELKEKGSELMERAAEVGRLQVHVERMEAEHEMFRELLRAHSGWDQMVIAEMKAQGITLPPPPPLPPPARTGVPDVS